MKRYFVSTDWVAGHPTRGQKTAYHKTRVFIKVPRDLLARRKKSVTQPDPLFMGSGFGYWYKFKNPTFKIRAFLASSDPGAAEVLNLKTTTSQKCEAVPRRARI